MIEQLKNDFSLSLMYSCFVSLLLFRRRRRHRLVSFFLNEKTLLFLLFGVY